MLLSHPHRNLSREPQPLPCPVALSPQCPGRTYEGIGEIRDDVFSVFDVSLQRQREPGGSTIALLAKFL